MVVCLCVLTVCCDELVVLTDEQIVECYMKTLHDDLVQCVSCLNSKSSIGDQIV